MRYVLHDFMIPSQVFPGDTGNPIDPLQGNMLEIEKRDCGYCTGDNITRYSQAKHENVDLSL